MNIGVVGPFNPNSIRDYLQEDQLPSINVSTTAVNTLVYEFLSLGHYVKIFTLSYVEPQKYRVIRGQNVEVHLIPTGIFPKFLGNHQMVVGPLFLPKRMAKIIGNNINGLDILHAHWTYDYAKAVSYFSDQIPVFDTVRDWCPYQLSLMKGRSKVDWKLKNFIFKQVMADENINFIANSTYTYRMIKKDYPNKEVPIIFNPIDKRWIVNKHSLNSCQRFISIATGILSIRKNITKLLEAFKDYVKQYPSAQLHLVGRYDKTHEMYLYWENRSLLNNVYLHGTIPHDDLIILLDKMSCLVHPSLEETFGNILLEAMSRGVICVGGEKSGAVPEVLGYGKYGVLCDVTNSNSILDAMLKCNDMSFAKKIQQDATAMLYNNFSSDEIAKKHIALFENKIKQENE